MRVLLVTPHLRVGGVPKYVLSLSRGLCEKGCRVVVASSGGEWEGLLDPRATFVRVPLDTKSILSLKVLKTASALVGLIRTHQIEVMHANTRVGQCAAFLASKMTGVPYVSTYHGFYKAHVLRKALTLAGKRAIAISSAVKTHMLVDLHIPESKVAVVHNGLDLAEYTGIAEKSAIRAKYGIAGDRIVSIVARLSREKNHLFLLDAFALVLKRFPGVRLVICGNGREADAIWLHARKIDVTHAVTMIPCAAAKEIFAVSDAVVLPSTEEGFGYSLIEAQAVRRCPVIGSAIGGITDIIEHGKTGLIFERFEPRLLADAIERVLSDAVFAYDLTDNAYRSLAEKFTLATMAEKTIAVYRSAMQRTI